MKSKLLLRFSFIKNKYHRLNLYVNPLKHDRMQSWANGKYEAQYQIYDGIWTNKHRNTKSLLSKIIADTKVPRSADPKTILVNLRF